MNIAKYFYVFNKNMNILWQTTLLLRKMENGFFKKQPATNIATYFRSNESTGLFNCFLTYHTEKKTHTKNNPKFVLKITTNISRTQSRHDFHTTRKTQTSRAQRTRKPRNFSNQTNICYSLITCLY